MDYSVLAYWLTIAGIIGFAILVGFILGTSISRNSSREKGSSQH